ncbi:lipopolysaccharide biosynthesis glycosyltransferase [Pedobacter sp. UYP24]
MDSRKQGLNLVFTIDENFVRHFSVALVSVLENNKDLDLNIFVIHDIENLNKLTEVIDFFKAKYDFKVRLLSLDNSVLANFKVSLHLSKAVYFRLFLPEILPKDLDKILFLDSDLVVTNTLRELAEFKFTDQALLAQNDIELDININRLNEMGFPVRSYFNAGVMLINLKYWREGEYSKKLLDIADMYMDKLSWWDQDILNICFYDSWEYFDKTYNALHLRKKLDKLPIIVHYAGPSKPWQYMNSNPYRSQYWKYQRLTPYKDTPLEGHTLKNIWEKNYVHYKVWLINTFTDKNY